MTTKLANKEQKNFVLQCMDIPRQSAAKLHFNNISQDFRDLSHKIYVPNLLITGKVSLHPWQSYKWMNGQIPLSKLEIVSEEEKRQSFPICRKT